MATFGPGNQRAWRGMLALAALLALLVALALFSSRLLPRCTGPSVPPTLHDSIVRLDSIANERAMADSITRANRRRTRRASSRPKKSVAPRRASRKAAASTSLPDTLPPDSPHNHPISSHK